MTSPSRPSGHHSPSASIDIDPWNQQPSTSSHSRQHHSRTLSSLSQTEASGSPLRRRKPRNGSSHLLDEVDNSPPNGIHGNHGGSSTALDETELRRSNSHPLKGDALIDAGDGEGKVVIGDSRPTLTRYVSETRRHVAESSKSGESSTRGSLDLLRMSKAEEVEVFIHQVQTNESLAGIALLYGIDLPNLRKVNKLWPSDPVHLRTHLYIPLEACRWNKASETFVRGPGEGQATLTPKTPHMTSEKGKGKARADNNSLIDLQEDTRASLDTIRPAGDPPSSTESGPEPRILDIVRIPNSQFQFFPRAQVSSSRPSLDMARRSIEGVRPSDNLRRTSSMSSKPQPGGSDIHHDLSTLPTPLKPPDHKSKVVRLRPPTAQTKLVKSDSLADKLSSLFTVPPPPATYAPIPHPLPPSVQRSTTKSGSNSGSTPSSPRTTGPLPKQPEVVLEMFSREARYQRRKKEN